jgi:hypothetical protein
MGSMVLFITSIIGGCLLCAATYFIFDLTGNQTETKTTVAECFEEFIYTQGGFLLPAPATPHPSNSRSVRSRSGRLGRVLLRHGGLLLLHPVLEGHSVLPELLLVRRPPHSRQA